MAKTHHTPATPAARRHVLVGLAMLGTAPGIALASTAPDAALLAAVARFRRHDAQIEAASAAIAAADTWSASLEVTLSAATDGWDGALAEIEATKATTLAGLKAKAGAVAIALQRMVVQGILPEDGGFEEQSSSSERLAMRFAREVQAMEIGQ